MDQPIDGPFVRPRPARLIWTVPLLAVTAVVVFIFGLHLVDALIRPVALSRGKPAMATVTGKRHSLERGRSGNYVTRSYPYAPGSEAHAEVRVNADADNAIPMRSAEATIALGALLIILMIDSARRHQRGGGS